MARPGELAIDHLQLRMQPLLRALRVLVARRDALAAPIRDAGAVADAVTRGHADALLDQLAMRQLPWLGGAQELTEAETRREVELHEQALAAGARLPLLALAADLGLDRFETDVLALCASVELDSEYERVLAYIHDDVTRRGVSLELAAGLTASNVHEYVSRRVALGPLGRLRRLGLVQLDPKSTNVRDEIRPTAAALRTLHGCAIDTRVAFRDPAMVSLTLPPELCADDALVERTGRALLRGTIDIVGVWGRARSTRQVVAALAARAGMPVRRFPTPGSDAAGALAAAAALGAMLWIDLDELDDRAPRDLVEACRASSTRVVLTGAAAWRPTELLADRTYVEIAVRELGADERRRAWTRCADELADDTIEQIASFRFDATEIRAAVRTARALAQLRTNGHDLSANDCIAETCAIVARKQGERHTTLVRPRRTAADLVLPPDVHARVYDVVTYHRTNHRVMDDWGFGRRVSGSGVKALFTGDPGTGKTLAAEVIAGELGLALLKVDLARVVSKWVGETEKNLDQAFREAEDSHAVLFFDEAEALFGTRGEVRHGTDRYANLEVSFLLQRLEEHAGVVILASNLRDKIDPAFLRRFHVVVGFPRPSQKERLRLWQSAFPRAAPLSGTLDVTTLARLDLTGAGIVAAAQTAASLAASEGTSISMEHVVRALARQFQREARVLNTHELGAHAVHLRTV